MKKRIYARVAKVLSAVIALIAVCSTTASADVIGGGLTDGFESLAEFEIIMTILVCCVVAATVVLIRVNWEKSKTVNESKDDKAGSADEEN